jgi:CubicO group peptidase (beta-lactamase class C family)
VETTFCQSGDAIDKYIHQTMTEEHIPGTAIAVIKNGKVIKEGYYGIANLEDNIPVTGQSVFEIASMSKQFTCAAILLLQEDGKISVDDKISKYLDSLPASWQNITVRQLMNHTSGLRDDWDENTGYFLENYTDEKMFAAQKKVPLLFIPGEMFNYSSGPFDLGLIIKKISGKTYTQFLEDRIFKPLSMTSTSVYDNRRIIPHRVTGYVWRDTIMQNGADVSPAAEARGDVGIITSLPDMIKWDIALRDNTLLNAESRKEMFEPGKLNDGTYIGYGYGWFIRPQFGHSMIEHSGGFRTGFHSDIMRFRDIDLDVILLSNQWRGRALCSRIAAMADTALTLPSQMQIQKDPDPKRTETMKLLLENFMNKFGNDSAMYKRIFLGYILGQVRQYLKGFKELTYIDKLDLQTHPMVVYDEKISKIIFYKVDAEAIKFLSFSFTDSGKLVCIIPEDDF